MAEEAHDDSVRLLLTRSGFETKQWRLRPTEWTNGAGENSGAPMRLPCETTGINLSGIVAKIMRVSEERIGFPKFASFSWLTYSSIILLKYH